jgi:hypothetical protein
VKEYATITAWMVAFWTAYYYVIEGIRSMFK